MPGLGGGCDSRGGRVPAGREATAGGWAGVARSVFAAKGLAAWLVDSYRPAGSEAGPLVGPQLSGPSQSASGQAPAARTALPIHLSLLSGVGGCDQQSGGAGDALVGG